VLVVEAETHPGSFGQQVGATVRDLPQFGDRRLDVDGVRLTWRPAVPASLAVMISLRVGLADSPSISDSGIFCGNGGGRSLLGRVVSHIGRRSCLSVPDGA
jgi:hypothetical protein